MRVAIVLATAFLVVSVPVALGNAWPGDVSTLTALRAAIGEVLDPALWLMRRATNPPLLAAAATVIAILLLRAHRRWDTAYFLAAAVVVWLVNPLLKQLFARPRPGLWPTTESVSPYTFPSGHAANTAALLGATLMVLSAGRRRAAVAAAGGAFVAVVGVGQLVLGVHYPSDVVGGWLWAGAWVALVWSLSSSSGSKDDAAPAPMPTPVSGLGTPSS